MPIKTIKTTFNAGELSEYISGRTDINKYYNGCSRLVNGTVLPHGGVVKRSGTEYIAQAPNKCNLFSFEFSVDDSLVLEFSNLNIRFYKDGNRVLETAVNISGATQANPVVVTTSASHGYSNGDWIRITGIDGMVELNDKEYIVANVTATTFELTDLQGSNIDGTGYTAYASDGTVARVYEITSPYTSAESFEIHTTQSADVMYIAHEDHPPQKLSRFSDTNWTISDVDFTGGPFLDENLTSTTLTYTSDSTTRSGSNFYFPVDDTGTLTSSSAVFQGSSLDVGTLWQIKHTRADNSLTKSGTGNWFTGSYDTGSGGATSTSAAIDVKGDFNLDATGFATNMTVEIQRKEGNGDWQSYRTFTAAVAYSSTEEFDDVQYRVVATSTQAASEISFVVREQTNCGIVQVTASGTTTSATVVVIEQVGGESNSGTATSATKMWLEGAWGKFRGYPRTVTFFEDRLWWASSTNNPDTLWGSVTSVYENHTTSGLGVATDAITAPFNDNEVSQIQWMIPRQVMAVGAANREYKFGNPDPDKAVSPEPGGLKATPQTSLGSDKIQPVILNNSIFFFQRQGRKLRALQFDAIAENFDSEDATLIANTILESRPTKMAVQRVPDSIIWIIREDGTLLSFTYEPKEEVSGWARHVTGSMASNILNGMTSPTELYESVTVIHGTLEDEVWVSVLRVISGNSVRYIEKFSTRIFDQIDEANMLDSAITEATGFISGELILASDTVRYGSGTYSSSFYGGIA